MPRPSAPALQYPHALRRQSRILTRSQNLRPAQIAYVLGTEDFFHRRRKGKASADKAARSSKFAAFIAKHAAPAAPAAAAAPMAVA